MKIMLGFSLTVVGLLTVLVGAGTSDMRMAMGVPSRFDELILGVIGLIVFSAGTIILADEDMI